MCSRCGDDCHCDAGVRSQTSVSSQPRFQVESTSVCLVDPEAFDRSEEQFSASLAGELSGQAPRFVPDQVPASIDSPAASIKQRLGETVETSADESPVVDSAAAGSLEVRDPSEWRRQVTARLDQYRSRRKVKSPRYPSLRLKFDPPEQSWNVPPTWAGGAPTGDAAEDPPLEEASYPVTRSAVARVEQEACVRSPKELRIEEVEAPEVTEPTAKIIEFPRSYNPPVRMDELADPVIDTPRILEAPEVVPPPPAMGGILIEPAEAKEPERRRGFEIPLKSASLTRRLAAALIDLLIVVSGAGAFGYLVERLVAPRLPMPRLAEAAGAVLVIFWTLYQYLLIVYNGSTPGLRATRLSLRRFDGQAVSRRARKWRVITSVLSGLSLGLGYAWSFLDEDALCWHDRITHTYMEPQAPKSKD